MTLHEGIHSADFKHFHVKTLFVQSRVLQKNPLKDPSLRRNIVLVPKKTKKKWPVIFALSGYGGNGLSALSKKHFDNKWTFQIDKWVGEKKAPQGVYVFVDAITFWGGSQFLNSFQTGQYEDYIIKELVKEVDKLENLSGERALLGASSGGYGALHLGSAYPEIFSSVAALAPDSFFEASLLPDIYRAGAYLKKRGGLAALKKQVEKKESVPFPILNAVAMGLCYAPSKGKEKVQWPICDKGILNPTLWKVWKEKDPLVFLKKRKNKVKKIKNIFLEVGDADEFDLQYGARQIQSVLKELSVPVSYGEFSGGHFDMLNSYKKALLWLEKKWRTCHGS